MSSPVRKIAIVIALVITIAAHKATAAPEFYTNLLRRGISEFNAGRFSSAATLLRTAAFGLLDAVDQFETAQAYFAVASQRLGRDGDARHATRRILMAERIQRRFAALPLPPELRTEFNEVARRYLTGAEHAALLDSSAPTAPRQADAGAVRRRSSAQLPEEAKPPAATPEPQQPQVAVARPVTSAVPPPQPGTVPAAEGAARNQPVDTQVVPPSAKDVAEADRLVKEKARPSDTAAVATPVQTPSTVPPPKAAEAREQAAVTTAPPAPDRKPEQVTAPAPITPAVEPPKREQPKASPKVEPAPVAVEPAPEAPKPTPQPEVARPAEPQRPVSTPEARETQKAEPARPEPDRSAPTEAAKPAPQPAKPVPARTETPEATAEARPPAPTPSRPSTAPAPAAPPQEAIREAQREFERKVVEVEKSAAVAKPQPPHDVTKALQEAAAALDRKDVFEARARLRSVLAVPNLKRSDLLKVAEESYRAQDFTLTVEAFGRAGALQRGEEAYGYYLAVGLYEVGRYADAKAALAEALPHIEVTGDVARYRAKIEGAVH